MNRCDGKYTMIKSEIEVPESWLYPVTHRNNTPLPPLDRGEIVDLERMNFLAWYRRATQEDMRIARRNNAKKLDELMKKYAKELKLFAIIHG